MLSARKELTDASAVLNGKIYIMGGTKSDGTITDEFHRYDPATDSWDSLAPFPIPVWRASLAVVGTKVYGFGGYQSLNPFPFNPTKNAYVYEPALDMWTPIADMIIERGSAASVVIDGKIHLVGGANTNALIAHHVYNPITDVWEVRGSLAQARSGLTATAIDGKIIATGGYFLNPGVVALSSTEIYDTATNSWSPAAPMPLAKLGISSAVAHGQMYVFGNTGNRNVLEYNPISDSWAQLGLIPEYVNFSASAGVHDTIYVFGGGSVNLSTDGINKANAYIPDAPTGLGSPGLSGFRIFPNPSPGRFSIEMEEEKSNSGITIYSAQGKLVFASKKIPETEIRLDLAPGIYHIKISGSGRPIFHKLIIE